MFERRLKIFLAFLVLITVMLLMRAVQVQLIDHTKWAKKATDSMQTIRQTETFRGRILDAKGQVLAVDSACTDACVDYRVIQSPADTKWVKDFARNRIKSRVGGNNYDDLSLAKRTDLLAAEVKQVNADIENMWETLATLYHPDGDNDQTNPRAAIEEIRHNIAQRVEMRRRWVWYRNFQRDKTQNEDAPRWRKWIMGSAEDGPDIDKFEVEVDEETQAHPILRALDNEACIMLGKQLEQLPGLVLQPSIHRQYPMHEVACHVIGRLSRVAAADMKDQSAGGLDESRAYLANDQIGREGIESLCEPLLRGSRGKIEQIKGEAGKQTVSSFVPGEDVSITIDSDLQSKLQNMLKNVREKKLNGQWVNPEPEPAWDMHGAIVVLNLKNNEVLAMASNPTFDLDKLDDQYAALIADKIDAPLKNRATCDEYEPGSSIKPMVGLAGITQGVIKPLDGIECTGYLVLPNEDGSKRKFRTARCWVASENSLADLAQYGITSQAHHPIPYAHRGHDGNPDGWLTFSDSLERSCDIYFENVADRLGPEGMAYWFDQFGFGRKTGIGITEMRGLRPGQGTPVTGDQRIVNCLTGTGQHTVWATPLQVANEAATIARNGIWMRPTLLPTDVQARLDKLQSKPSDQPNEVDLHLDPEGLRQAKIGMIQATNGDADGHSGTGEQAHSNLVTIAAKTGTAQASRIREWITDANGDKVRSYLPLVTKANPVTRTPWYRASNAEGTTTVHGWMMGFAPAEKPEIAFCVFIEYSGSGGGGDCGPIVKQLVEECIARGYVHPHSQPPIASATLAN